MIEAVNSVLSNAPIARAVVDQQSVTASYAANPDRVQVVAHAPYISPYVHVDVNYNKAVLQIRDSDTGDVVRTIPTEGQMEAYRRAQSAVTPALNRPEPEEQVVQPQETDIPVHTAPVQQSAPVSASSAPAQTVTAPVAAPVQASVNTQV